MFHGGKRALQGMMSRVSARQGGGCFRGEMVGLKGDDAYLHSSVEVEKDDPRRKLPGGQSSLQSLRGTVNIVVWCMRSSCR